MPCPAKEKGFIEFETNFFKFLNIKEVLYMDWWFIIYMDVRYLHGWNDLYCGWVLRRHEEFVEARVCVSEIEDEEFFW